MKIIIEKDKNSSCAGFSLYDDEDNRIFWDDLSEASRRLALVSFPFFINKFLKQQLQ